MFGELINNNNNNKYTSNIEYKVSENISPTKEE